MGYGKDTTIQSEPDDSSGGRFIPPDGWEDDDGRRRHRPRSRRQSVSRRSLVSDRHRPTHRRRRRVDSGLQWLAIVLVIALVLLLVFWNGCVVHRSGIVVDGG